MKMSNDQVKNIVSYFVLCCHLRDFIEENVEGAKFNYQTTKMLTKNLSKELEKSINIIFDVNGFSEEDKTDMLGSFINATFQMDKFFKIGLLMQDMSEEDQKSFSSDIEQIIKKYGIEY